MTCLRIPESSAKSTEWSMACVTSSFRSKIDRILHSLTLTVSHRVVWIQQMIPEFGIAEAGEYLFLGVACCKE